jgi:diaminopimelate epimerase
METQVIVNGEVIILADTKPLYNDGFAQWRNINTGQTWNVDGSIAEACYNADIAQYRTSIVVPIPEKHEHHSMEWEVFASKGKGSIFHRIVDEIEEDWNVNQTMIYRLWNGDIFIETWEHGVGLVPSCGTATIAVAMKEQVNEIYCRGGKYNIEFFEKYLTLEAENIS